MIFDTAILNGEFLATARGAAPALGGNIKYAIN